MFCQNCGNAVKETYRFCTICGAEIEKGSQDTTEKEVSDVQDTIEKKGNDSQDAIHPKQEDQQVCPMEKHPNISERHLQEAGDQRQESQRKKRTKAPIILGAAIVLILGVGGFFIAKALGFWGSPDITSSGAKTAEETIPPQSRGIFEGDGFTLTYDKNIWKPENIEGQEGLMHKAGNRSFLIRTPNEIPQSVAKMANFSNGFLNKNIYTMTESLIETAIKGGQRGYSIIGGSERFFLLKDETYYATMEYTHEKGFSGTFYVLVSQEDGFNLVCLTKIEEAKNDKIADEDLDKDVITLLKSIQYTGH